MTTDVDEARADAGKHSERMLDFMIQHTNSLTRLFEILEQFTIERDRLRTENERLQADVSNLLQAIEGKDSALDRLRSFSPTAQHINALPESLRRYIHDIETRCDPAGDIRELTITKDENRMLRAKCERYERERESLLNTARLRAEIRNANERLTVRLGIAKELAALRAEHEALKAREAALRRRVAESPRAWQHRMSGTVFQSRDGLDATLCDPVRIVLWHDDGGALEEAHK